MSRPNIVSIDQLQHEIDEAERYLRSNLSFKVVNKPLINESKVTKPSPSPEIPSSSSKSLKNRYTDPIEREKLLQRLLNEHNMKKSSTPQSVTRNTQSPAEIPEEVSSNTSHLSELESPQKLNDTLFYASEITPAKRYPNSEDNQFYDPFDKLHQLPHDTNEVIDESRAEEEDESIENDSMNSNYQQSASSPQVSTRYGYKNLNKTIKSQPESQKDPQNTQGKKRYQKTKEELVQEAREEFRRQYTFQPNLITTTGKQSAERSSPYQSSTTATTTATTTTTNPRKRSSSVNRIEAMLKLHEQKLINREKQKKEVEKAQVDLFCTFKPEICPGTNEILQKKYNEDLYHEQLIQQEQYDEYDTSRLSRSHRKISDSTTRPKSAPPTRTKTVTQRLYHDAEKKKQKQQIIQKELNQVYKSEYPFHPSINPITNSIVKQVNGAEYRPIYERVGDVQRQIVINKQILTNSYEEEMKNSTPFRPKIDHYSEKLIQQKRLKQSEESKDGASEQERKERLSNEIFHPNEGSGGSSSRKEEDDDGKNHVENRLLDEGKKQVMRKYQLIASREQELANQIKTPKPCKGSQEILEQKNIG